MNTTASVSDTGNLAYQSVIYNILTIAQNLSYLHLSLKEFKMLNLMGTTH